jgi:predicted AAA+ superfamily ATPase
MPGIELPFSDTTSPEEMRRHPLGIRVRFKEIAESLKAGRGSILIAAPRRFGKTTLLNALLDGHRLPSALSSQPITLWASKSIPMP